MKTERGTTTGKRYAGAGEGHPASVGDHKGYGATRFARHRLATRVISLILAVVLILVLLPDYTPASITAQATGTETLTTNESQTTEGSTTNESQTTEGSDDGTGTGVQTSGIGNETAGGETAGTSAEQTTGDSTTNEAQTTAESTENSSGAASGETAGTGAVCTCTVTCTADAVNKDCAVCGAEGADLTACTGASANADTEETNASAATVTAWTWGESESVLTEMNGEWYWGLGGLSGLPEEERPTESDLAECLPTYISATVDGASDAMTLTLGAWTCENFGYTEDGSIPEGGWTFKTELSDKAGASYVLAEGLSLTVHVAEDAGQTADAAEDKTVTIRGKEYNTAKAEATATIGTGITAYLFDGNTVAYITGSGTMSALTSYDSHPLYSYKSTLKYIKADFALTADSSLKNLFYELTNVISIDMSAVTGMDYVTSMENCFCRCKGMTSVSLPQRSGSNQTMAISGMFYYCSSLTKINFPENFLKNITNYVDKGLALGDYTFSKTDRLRFITVQGTVDALIYIQYAGEKYASTLAYYDNKSSSWYTSTDGGQTKTEVTKVKDAYTEAGYSTETYYAISAGTYDTATTFYLDAKPITYNINYDLNNGTATGANPTSYTVESDSFTLSNPTRDGYEFAGWTVSDGAKKVSDDGTPTFDDNTNITIDTGYMYGDVTFTATWEKSHESHGICGVAGCTDDHGNLTWTELKLSDLKADGYGYIISTPGNYYLKKDIDLNNDGGFISIDTGVNVNLCLNGHKITNSKKVLSGSGLINMNKDASLTICDCSDDQTGEITYTTNGMDSGGSIVDCNGYSTSFSMYGGTIKAGSGTNTDYALNIAGSQTVNIYGGTISHPEKAIAITSTNSGAQLNISGGTIEQTNSSVTDTAAIYSDVTTTYYKARITLSGAPNITAASGSAVYLAGSGVTYISDSRDFVPLDMSAYTGDELTIDGSSIASGFWRLGYYVALGGTSGKLTGFYMDTSGTIYAVAYDETNSAYKIKQKLAAPAELTDENFSITFDSNKATLSYTGTTPTTPSDTYIQYGYRKSGDTDITWLNQAAATTGATTDKLDPGTEYTFYVRFNTAEDDYIASEPEDMTKTVPHKHCVCNGKNSPNHVSTISHDDITFTVWDGTGLTLSTGNYYLTKDITLTDNITISGNVNLCLNGNTINMSSGHRFIVTGTLTVTDCSDTPGEIKSATDSAEPIVEVSGGAFNLFGGSLVYDGSSDASGAVNITKRKSSTDASLSIYGGSITSDQSCIRLAAAAPVDLKGGSLKTTNEDLAAVLFGAGVTGAYNISGVSVVGTSFDGNAFYITSKSGGDYALIDLSCYSGGALTVVGAADFWSRGSLVASADNSGLLTGNYKAESGELYTVSYNSSQYIVYEKLDVDKLQWDKPAATVSGTTVTLHANEENLPSSPSCYIEYACRKMEDDQDSALTWQDSYVFSDLDPETSYIFYARINTNESNYVPSEPIVTGTINTGKDHTTPTGTFSMPGADDYEKWTDEKITITFTPAKNLAEGETIEKLEYSIDDGYYWTEATTSDNGTTYTIALDRFSPGEQRTVRVRYAADSSYGASEAAKEICRFSTRAAKPYISADAIDYDKETITVMYGLEVSTNRDNFSEGKVTLEDKKATITPGTTYYIRYAANGDCPASMMADVTIAAREKAPEAGVGYTIDYEGETFSAITDGYEISTDSTFAGSSKLVDENDAVTPDTTYYVRKKAVTTGDSQTVAGNSTSFSFTRPDAPNAVIESDITKTDTTITIANVVRTQEYGYETGDGTITWVSGSEATDGKLTISGLTAGTAYTIVTRVAAVKGESLASKSSAKLEVTTKTAAAAATKVTMPTVDTSANAPTTTSITISVIEGQEYYISASGEAPTDADWAAAAQITENSPYYKTADGKTVHTFTGLTAGTKYYIYTRTAETVTAMPSESASVIQYTQPAAPTADELASTVKFDYGAETVSAADGYEIGVKGSDGKITWQTGAVGLNLDGTTPDLYVRKAATKDDAGVAIPAGAEASIASILPTRSDPPTSSEVSATNETIKGQGNGHFTFTGVTAGNYEYRTVTKTGTTTTYGNWTPCDGREGLAAGTYEVRKKAVTSTDGDKKLAVASRPLTVNFADGPQAKITLPDAKKQTGYTLTAAPEAVDYNGETKLTLTVAAGYTADKKYPLSVPNGTLTLQKETENTDGTVTYTYALTKVTTDTSVNAYVSDDTKPKFETVYYKRGTENIIANLWNWIVDKEKITVYVPITEKGSGLKNENIRIELTKDENCELADTACVAGDVKLDGDQTEGYVLSFTVPAGFSGTYKVTAKDNSGNTAEYTIGQTTDETEKIVVDNAYPTVTVNLGDDAYSEDKAYSYTDSVTVSMTVADSKVTATGLKKMTYKLDDGEQIDLTPAADADGYTAWDEKKTNNYEEKITVATKGAHELIVSVTDQAGNTTEKTVKFAVYATTTGASLTAEADITYDASAIAEGTDFTLEKGTSDGDVTYSYKAEGDTDFTAGLPTDAGTYTVKASIARDETNYYEATKVTTDVTIAKATPALSVSASTVTPGDTLSASILNGTATLAVTDGTLTVDGTFSWKDADKDTEILMNDAASVTCTAVFTPTDTANYETAETTVTVHISTVNERNAAISAIEKAATDAKDQIDAMTDLTDEQKTAYKDAVDKAANDAVTALKTEDSTNDTPAGVEKAQTGAETAIKNLVSDASVRNMRNAAEKELTAYADAAKERINSEVCLTDEQKAAFVKEIEAAEADAKAAIEAAETQEAADSALKTAQTAFDGVAVHYPLEVTGAKVYAYDGETEVTYGIKGATLIVKADDPLAGYAFDKWTDVTGIILTEQQTSEASFAFTMPEGEVTFTPTYKEIIAPVISGAAEGAICCGAPEITVTDNGTIDTGLADVTVNGVTVSGFAEGAKEFTFTPQATGTVQIVVTDKAGNVTKLGITINDGHTFTDYVRSDNASTQQNATETAKCEFCDATDTREIAGTKLTVPVDTVTMAEETEADGKIITAVNVDKTLPKTVISNMTAALAKSLLTNTELVLVQAGAMVKIYLDVTDISENVSEADKTLTESAIATLGSNTHVGMYLDLSLFKQINNNPATRLTSSGTAMIRVAVTVPESLRNTDSAYTRTYNVVRIHDGKAEFLNPSCEDYVLTFETDKFSTYAIVYTDTAVPAEPGTDTTTETPAPTTEASTTTTTATTTETSTTTAPAASVEPGTTTEASITTETTAQTGDSADLALWISVLLLAAAGIVIMTEVRRKRR